MALLALTPANIEFIKRGLRPGYPSIKSSHLSEAIAACGCHTNIALATAVRNNNADRPTLADVDNGSFLNRLADFGYPVIEAEALSRLVQSPELPDRIWYVWKGGHIPALNTWFRECQKRDIPYVYITPKRKYAQLDWDHMAFHPKHDDIVGSHGFDVVDEMFGKFQEIAKGASGKPVFFGSALVGNVKRLPVDLAPALADEIFHILYGSWWVSG